MGRDYLNTTYTDVRRADRAVEDQSWIKDFLKQTAVGNLATLYNQQPFINMNLFVYDEDKHCIYMHTAHVGRTIANIEVSNAVCFSAMEMGRLLPAKQALEFSVEYASVMVFGEVQVVSDPEEAKQALQFIMDKYAPQFKAVEDYRPPEDVDLKRTAVIKIEIKDWTGKMKTVGEHPGAYYFPEKPALASNQSRTYWQGGVLDIFITAECGEPIQSVETVKAVAGKGLEGDRHFGDWGEITFIAIEEFEAFTEEDIPLTPIESRRNILTRGVPLHYLVNKRFQVGDAIVEGLELCEPCTDLVRMTGYSPKLVKQMLRRGGLRARILKSGTIRAGDSIRSLDA
ncbi:hypothetical protein MASR2M15_00660 [Anaerolineales bacterium]